MGGTSFFLRRLHFSPSDSGAETAGQRYDDGRRAYLMGHQRANTCGLRRSGVPPVSRRSERDGRLSIFGHKPTFASFNAGVPRSR
ncbi:MAG: hypothetical protein ACI9BW_002714 [Gammaproteobacteria bacterium]|jgi:hypothetical protein